jgi:hypothetical protein
MPMILRRWSGQFEPCLGARDFSWATPRRLLVLPLLLAHLVWRQHRVVRARCAATLGE